MSEKLCSSCIKWFIRSETHYGNDQVIVRWKSDESKGTCLHLNATTDADFGCIRYKEGGPLIKIENKPGEPWHYSVGGPCPDCKRPHCRHPTPGAIPGNCTYEYCPGMNKCIGFGSTPSGIDNRCYGTGQVSYYDDGFIGDGKIKKHPKESAGFKRPDAPTPQCANCKFDVNDNWNICPNCGYRLKEPTASTEFVDDKDANMGAA